MIFPQKDVRNQVIQILSEDFPLSFRKLSNQLKKQSSSTSDKALYRILALMTKQGLLIKKDKEYMINPGWMDNLDKFVNKTAKNYIESEIEQKSKRQIADFLKQQCACEEGYAEGFCYVCNELVCSKCGEKTRLHYSCLDKCESCDKKAVGKCANCLKEACPECSKQTWVHFSENCIEEKDKAVFGVVEIDHQCWFADLSEKVDNPIVLDSFVDSKDRELETHSGKIIIEKTDKKIAIKNLLKHKQIVDVKPIYVGKQLVLRTRALFNKSVDEFARKNKAILLNPIKASDTKERNLIIAPSHKEIRKLIKGVNESGGKCRIIATEEIELNNPHSISSKEILSFVRSVNDSDLNSATQKIRLLKKFGG